MPAGAEIIPHAHLSLRDIEIAAGCLPKRQRAVFLAQQYDNWAEYYAKFVCRFPGDDPSDFLLVVIGIRRLLRRALVEGCRT